MELTVQNLTNEIHKVMDESTPEWKENKYSKEFDIRIKKLIISERNYIRKTTQRNICKECRKMVNRINNKIKRELHQNIDDNISKCMKNLEVKNGENGITFNKVEIANAFSSKITRVLDQSALPSQVLFQAMSLPTLPAVVTRIIT
ncbi:hypothetical protein PV328_004136 [Microctonus aethiopoides]|uniref:Uncharacterized protein n=1 Tax=Microctonus aethiopoides TaxID=144406 RepID=A0AA39FA45_9HYME|nr:hypothetical protein PV328_004136 [Microctonus aethiopoides]